MGWGRVYVCGFIFGKWELGFSLDVFDSVYGVF